MAFADQDLSHHSFVQNGAEIGGRPPLTVARDQGQPQRVSPKQMAQEEIETETLAERCPFGDTFPIPIHWTRISHALPQPVLVFNGAEL